MQKIEEDFNIVSEKIFPYNILITKCLFAVIKRRVDINQR